MRVWHAPESQTASLFARGSFGVGQENRGTLKVTLAHRDNPAPRGLIVAGVVAILILSGCRSEDSPSSEEVTFHFKMAGDITGLEDFRAVTSDPQTIAMAREQLALQGTEPRKHIVGSIGHGDGGFNLNWNWHFLRDSWTLAEASIELCDTGPVLISQCVECWVNVRGAACPWGSYVAYEVLE